MVKEVIYMCLGTITKIESQKKGIERVNIYVDGEFAFSCSTEIVYSEGLKSGIALDSDKLGEIVSEDEYLRCKNSALNMLEKSYKSEKEVRDKLSGKGYEERTIERVMEFLKKYNFVDDTKYAEMYIKEKIKTDGMSKIKYSLMRKGICENIIKDKLEQVRPEAILAAAEELAEKKYSLLIKNESDTRKIYKKLGEYLMRKGYSWNESKTVLRKILSFEDRE